MSGERLNRYLKQNKKKFSVVTRALTPIKLVEEKRKKKTKEIIQIYQFVGDPRKWKHDFENCYL